VPRPGFSSLEAGVTPTGTGKGALELTRIVESNIEIGISILVIAYSGEHASEEDEED
jgi:hypothetical protein